MTTSVVSFKQINRYFKCYHFHFLKDYKSFEFPTLEFSKHLGDSEILFSLPPDPLHINLLGAGNDVCDCLERHFSTEMLEFYAENHLKKSGQGPGGKFNGPSIKYNLREDVLIILENKLPVSASSFINYFRAIRNLHELCVSEELGDFNNVLHDFKVNFEFLNEEFLLPMTLKIHVILHHYSDYFEWTGNTMRYTNAEFTETAHATFKMSERIHHLTSIEKSELLYTKNWH